MDADARTTGERWAQFTYASFDDGTGPGGWQVKETVGHLTDVETEALRSRVVTSFAAAEPLPPFPTPAEIAALPRRFTYAPTGVGSSWASWHAVQAGADGTGRPGNVFSHVVLDRTPEDDGVSTLRPVLTWRSSWAAPFGQQLVRASRITGNPALEPGPLDRAAVLAFLLDAATWRVGTFAVLLDAVRDALAGGPTVVLLTDAPDVAAAWAAAVSLFMSPATSRRFALSLFERATDVDAALERGLHLVAVPRPDAAALTERRDIVVIDDQDDPALGDPGGTPHTLGDGRTVPVSRWSVLAQVALTDTVLADATLRALDEVGVAVGDVASSPEWPLAMVIAAHGADIGQGELLDARDEAADVLAEHSPAHLQQHPVLWTATAAMLGGRFGTTTEDALAIADGDAADGRLLSGLAARVYVERALADRSWLARPGQIRVPHLFGGAADVALVRGFEGALADRVHRIGAEAPAPGAPLVAAAMELLHLLDLADGAGFPLFAPTGLSQAERLVEMLVAPALLDRDAEILVERTGPVRAGVRSLVREVMASTAEVQGRPVGAVLPDSVVRWMYAPQDPLVPRADGMLEALDRERVIAECRTGDAARVADFRHLAFVDVARATAAHRGPSLDHRLLTAHAALVDGAPWSAAQVRTTWRLGAAVPDRTVARALAAAADGADLDELLALPLPDGLAEAEPLGRLRVATQDLVHRARGTSKGLGTPAHVRADEIITSLSSAGTATDRLLPLPEISDPVVAAVALRAVSSIVPPNSLVWVPAEGLARGASAVGVRVVLDLLLAEAATPPVLLEKVVEFFVRTECAAVSRFAPGDPLWNLSRLAFGTHGESGGSSVSRVLAEAVFDADPSTATDALEQATRLLAERPAPSSPELRGRHQDDDVVRALFTPWLGSSQPTKNRTGLLGRLGRNEVS